jgi:photosystem II stability/assembly factor-like uncharacterized protein
MKTATVLVLLIASTAFAGWSSSGPTGGSVNAVVVAPSDPSVVWAANTAGVFRSTDGGATWSNVSGPVADVAGLVVHPDKPDTAWALSTMTGLYRTVDGGATWIGPDRQFAGTFEPTLLLDPRDPDTLYVGSGCFAGFEPVFPRVYGLFKSTDGGETWARDTNLAGLSVCVNELAIDPFSPWRLFAAGPYSDVGGRLESYDGTGTWQRPGAARPSREVVFDPRFPFTHYGITERFGSAFLISQDGGFTWSAAATQPPAEVRALSIDPQRGRLFLGTTNGLFRSGDSGRVWAKARLPESNVNALDFGGVPPAVFAATNQGLYQVVNRGLGESRLIDLHDISTNVMAVDVDPSDPNVLVASTSDSVFGTTPIHGRVYRSTNGGASWERLPNEGDIEFTQIAVDAGGTAYASSFRAPGIYRYSDDEAKWKIVRANITGPLLVTDPKTPGTIFTAGFDHAERSRDGGATWRNLSVGGNYLAIDRSDPRWIYLGSENHLYRSADGGDTWVDLQPEIFLNGTRGIVVAPSNGMVVYRIGAHVGSPRPERSDDRGMTWRPATLPGGVFASALAVDPRDENSVWAFAYEGLYHSTDGGAHWTQVDGPFGTLVSGTLGTAVSAPALRFDPTGHVLHVAYPGHGVWELTGD